MRRNRVGRGPVASVVACCLAACAGGARGPVDATDDVPAWPQFRGPRASGVAEGQDLPATWDGTSGEHVRWKLRIPGLAHASPIVWGDRVFVTSAVDPAGEATFKPGLYGSGDAADDSTRVHRWIVLAVDARSGRPIWERTAHEGLPRDKRHVKATYANSTPATDGRRVVALFGSEGLFAFDLDGSPLWHVDLGRLDLGAYDAPDYEWGSASSPILHGERVFVQCDTQGEDWVRALDASSGETIWNAERDELPAWGTPTLWSAAGEDVLVTNASRHVRGYDPLTGEELWRFGNSSSITAPTPVADPASGLLVVASGRRPERPLSVIRPGARGDLTLAEGETGNEFVAWHARGAGPYMPTPLVYGGRLYVLNNDGVFAAFELETGREIYRVRVPHRGSGFSASPVAADGRLYLPSEDGQIFVVAAGDAFEILATNAVPEPVMATPAIAGGTLYVRGESHLYAISR